MEIVKFWDTDIHEECDDEEDTADNATDGVGKPQRGYVIIETTGVGVEMRCWIRNVPDNISAT